MITKVTKENKASYKALFERATREIFGDTPEEYEKITSLDAYFAVLKALLDKDPIYTVLPLDEPVFAIDTNTRQITVPNDFKKNGISVQGDEVSEILYFSVDRYADSMDLYRDDIHIAIQWETAPNAKGVVEKGISPEWIRDITTLKHEGKMLFGWAINSVLTEHPGAIKFSVRFYHFDEAEKLDFNLNTLVATANINPSIDYKFDEEGLPTVQVTNNNNLIRSRIKDSEPPKGVEGMASEPVFLLDLPTTDLVTDTAGVSYNSIDLVEENGIKQILFKVQAVPSADAGIISYEWERTPLVGGQPEALAAKQEDFIRTEDKVYSSEHTYYKLVRDVANNIEYYEEVLVTPGMYDEEIPEDEVLFEKFSTFRVVLGDESVTGDYKVDAVNRVGLDRARKESTHIRIPGPDEESFAIGTPEGQEHSLLMGADDEEGSVTLYITSNTSQNGDDITYIWRKVGEEEILAQTTINNKDGANTQNSYTVKVAPELRKKYNEKFEVTTFASRNGDDTTSQVREIQVTDPAHEVIVTRVAEQVLVNQNAAKEIGVTVDASQVASEGISYQWYKQVGEADSLEDDTALPNSNAPIISLTFTPSLVDESKLIYGMGGGVFYCVVTNHVNNSTATTKSAGIFVGQNF